jgi:cathepsin E
MFPRSLNAEIGGNSNSTYLIMQDIGTPSGQGLDFINGFTFLCVKTYHPFLFSVGMISNRGIPFAFRQRYYSVFDTPNQQVGFATTYQTNATSN